MKLSLRCPVKMDIPDFLAIKKSRNGMGLLAAKPLQKGEVIFHFVGRIDNDPHTNPESLQIDEDTFLESTAKLDDFLNHSCEPNCFIDYKKLNLVALRDICQGEELSYNYNTSEYDLINLVQNCGFKCNCGSENCIGEVKGFRYLSSVQKRQVRRFLSPFLKKKYERESGSKF